MRGLLFQATGAMMLTACSIIVQSATDERAMYGFEGPLEQNWLPRKLAGWPAPFVADSPHTSVIHKIGPEDDFRPGPFVATLSFWYVATLGIARLWYLVQGRQARRSPAKLGSPKRPTQQIQRFGSGKQP